MSEAPRVWIMKLAKGMWYPITPGEFCKPEMHGKLNPQVLSIEDVDGNVLWEREPMP